MIATKTVLRASSVIVLNVRFRWLALNLLEAAAALPSECSLGGIAREYSPGRPWHAKHFESRESARRISSSQNDYNYLRQAKQQGAGG